jgi:hypothetical protein
MKTLFITSLFTLMVLLFSCSEDNLDLQDPNRESSDTADGVMQALKRIESAPPQQLDYLRRLFTESRG